MASYLEDLELKLNDLRAVLATYKGERWKSTMREMAELKTEIRRVKQDKSAKPQPQKKIMADDLLKQSGAAK